MTTSKPPPLIAPVPPNQSAWGELAAKRSHRIRLQVGEGVSPILDAHNGYSAAKFAFKPLAPAGL
jgi:hypothetical protein